MGMEGNEGPRGFKIDFNAEDSEAPERKPAASAKAQRKKPRPGRRAVRPVFLWLLLLIAGGGLIFLGYTHLNNRLLELESVNENELQVISGEIEQRLTGISELMREQTRKNRSLIREVEKSAKENTGEIGDIKNALAVIRKNISDLETSLTGRADNLEKRIKNTESAAESNQENIEELASSVEKLQGLESDINEAGRAMKEAQSRVDALDQRVSAMQDQLIGPESLEEKGREISRSLDRQLESEMSGIRNRFSELEDQLRALEAMINALENMQKQNGSRQSSGSSGEIIEQELD